MPLLGERPVATARGRRHSQALRYGIVVVGGYILDFGVSIAALRFFGFGLVAAACIGFGVAVIANYLAHEFWTFRTGSRPGRTGRLAKYIGVALATLAARAVCIHFLEPLALSDPSRIAVLVVAAGASLALNYILTKFFVFVRRNNAA